MIFKLILKNFYAKHISFWGWPIGQKSQWIAYRLEIKENLKQ